MTHIFNNNYPFSLKEQSTKVRFSYFHFELTKLQVQKTCINTCLKTVIKPV